VLIFGLGSIGLRHLEVLEEIGCFEIAAYRTKKGTAKLPCALDGRIKYFYDEDEAFDWRPDFMIVSNPTSLHLKYLLKSIDHGIDALIEKPVADDYGKIRAFQERIRNRRNSVYVGYNLRFHPIVQQVKKAIMEGGYGKVLKANLYVGQYLPLWHPYENYRKSYAARRELGGGGLRTLSHEIDLGQYLLGDYSRVFANVSRISGLEIDVDDTAEIFAEMKNGVLLNIGIDYLNPLGERNGRVFFEKGLLKYDFSRMEVEFTDYANRETETLVKLEGYDYNDQYKCQIQGCLNKSENGICGLEEGVRVMKVIGKCEESSQKKMMIDV